MKISEHFTAEEFVPKSIIDRFGDNAVWFINPHIVAFCEWMRNYTNAPIHINDWNTGGHRDSRGYRTPDDPDGAKLSQHRLTNAVDMVINGHTPEEVRNIIRVNFTELNEKFGITTIEKDTPTWTHVDCRWTRLDHLLEVPYK